MTVLAFLRPARRLDDSIKEAEKMGFRVLAASSIEIVPGDGNDFENAKKMLLNGKADISVISSATATEECIRVWKDDTSKILSGTHVIAIGPGTADSLKKNGIRTDSIPDVYSSQGVVDHLGYDAKGKNILLIRSDKGSDVLETGLRSNGATVTTLIAYRLQGTRLSDDAKKIAEEGVAGKIDVFAFTSPMSAESFFNAAEEEGYPQSRIIKKACIAAIGEPTASLLRSRGIHVDIVPKDATFTSLLKAIKGFIKM